MRLDLAHAFGAMLQQRLEELGVQAARPRFQRDLVLQRAHLAGAARLVADIDRRILPAARALHRAGDAAQRVEVMVHRGDAQFDRFQVLIGQVHVAAPLQQARCASRLAVHGHRQRTCAPRRRRPVRPLRQRRMIHQQVDVRPIGAFGVGKHAQGGGFHVHAHRWRIGQRMGADEVQLGRVRRRSRPSTRLRPASGSAGAAGRGRCPTASSPRRCAGGPVRPAAQVGAAQPPVMSNRGRAPISASACAIGPPSDLMLSDPTAPAPPCAAGWGGPPAAAACAAPSCMAKAVGMRNGSNAWMLRPVGRICGLRIRSPPGTGRHEMPADSARRRRAVRRPPSMRARAPSAACRPSGDHQLRPRPRRHRAAHDMQPVGDQRPSVSSSVSHSLVRVASRPGPPPPPVRGSAWPDRRLGRIVGAAPPADRLSFSSNRPLYSPA
jgi:hypothetical protein